MQLTTHDESTLRQNRYWGTVPTAPKMNQECHFFENSVLKWLSRLPRRRFFSSISHLLLFKFTRWTWDNCSWLGSYVSSVSCNLIGFTSFWHLLACPAPASGSCLITRSANRTSFPGLSYQAKSSRQAHKSRHQAFPAREVIFFPSKPKSWQS